MNNNLNDKLNVYLANQMVMYIKLHNLHWYIKGKSFFTLHGKLEELYDVTADIVDDVAERILALEGSPVASIKEALELSAVKELESKPISSSEVVKVLLKDVSYWINDTKEIVTLAEEANDGATADMFNGYLAEYQKLNWMLKSYLD